MLNVKKSMQKSGALGYLKQTSEARTRITKILFITKKTWNYIGAAIKEHSVIYPEEMIFSNDTKNKNIIYCE